MINSNLEQNKQTMTHTEMRVVNLTAKVTPQLRAQMIEAAGESEMSLSSFMNAIFELWIETGDFEQQQSDEHQGEIEKFMEQVKALKASKGILINAYLELNKKAKTLNANQPPEWLSQNGLVSIEETLRRLQERFPSHSKETILVSALKAVESNENSFWVSKHLVDVLPKV